MSGTRNPEAPDLSVRLGSLTLPNPFIVGSGPTVRSVEQIREAAEAGWAAASLKLAIDPEPYLSLAPRYRWLAKERLHAFTAERRLSTTEALGLLAAARSEAPGIALFANITYAGDAPGGWGSLARAYEDAGADALELNFCCPNMSYNVSASGGAATHSTGASLGVDLERLPFVVEEVVASTGLPVIAKLSPEHGTVAEAARVCIEAGATAVGSTANRLGIAPFDIRSPESSSFRLQEAHGLVCLSGPWIRPLALKDTWQIRDRVGGAPFVIGSGGVSDLESAAMQFMAGADAVWVCTATMVRGFSWLRDLLADLERYLAEMGCRSISGIRDRLHRSLESAEGLELTPGTARLDSERCNGCGLCWEIGHCLAISHPNGETTIDPARCTGCSTCVDLCRREALRMVASPG